MSEATDRAMDQANSLGGGVGRAMHQLIGCAWGYTITAPGHDNTPCMNGADQIVVLHRDFEDKVGTQIKLCKKHLRLVNGETTERTGPIA